MKNENSLAYKNAISSLRKQFWTDTHLAISFSGGVLFGAICTLIFYLKR